MARGLTKLSCEKRLDEIPRNRWSNRRAAHAKNIHVISPSFNSWAPKSTTSCPAARSCVISSSFKLKPP